MVMQSAIPVQKDAPPRPRSLVTPLKVTTWAMFGSTLLMVALPMLYLMYGSFVQDGNEGGLTLNNYAEVYGGQVFLSRFLNTVTLAATVAVLAVLLGALLAWVVARTNAPGVKRAAPLLIVPIMMSNLVTCLAWIALAAPNAGLLNVLIFNVTGVKRVLDIYSFSGMVWVLVLNYAAFAFVSILGALKSIDADLEEASYLLGVNPVRTAFSMTLPLIFVQFFLDVGLSVVLYSPNSMTITGICGPR